MKLNFITKNLLVISVAAVLFASCRNQAADQKKADYVAGLIDAIYVQQRTSETDAQCALAKKEWDKLTSAQKELVEGENADPDYFGRYTGDAMNDDPLNQDGIGENEILVVSFGTSFNDSRAKDIGGIERALAAAYPSWSVRRAFTAQIIINHVQAREDEAIDNIKLNTRHYVKRQITWLKREKDTIWFNKQELSDDEILKLMLNYWRKL